MSKRVNVFKIMGVMLALAMLMGACAPAATPTTAPTQAPVAGATTAPTVAPTKAPPTAAPAPTAEKPVDIELWAQPSVTEQGPPPADWIAYKIIREKLNINFKLVLTPTGADGETKTQCRRGRQCFA